MNQHHWWFLDLNWPAWLFLSLMVLAIIVLVVSHRSYDTVNRSGREVTRRVPSAFGLLFFTAVLYLGVHWEMWWWVWLLILIGWWVGLAAAVVYAFSGSFGNLARIGSHLAFLLVMLMLVISFFGWVGTTGFGQNAAAVFAGHSVSSSPEPSGTPSQIPTDSASSTPSPAPTALCTTSWEIKTLDHTGNRVIAEGIASIQNAKTNAQAKAAAHDAVHKVQTDPATLSGYIAYFLHKNVAPATLVTADKKCASDAAVSYATQLELALDDAKSITPDNAPENGTNSGVDNGTVVSATTVGITGNRKAVKVVLKDGTVVWIMARCGNPVTTGTPPVPHGKTEHQPPRVIVHHPRHTPPPNRCTPPPPKKGYKVVGCHYEKKAQTRDCMLNGKGCEVPNHATQNPQHNPGQPTGGTKGAPTQAPPPPPTQTQAPGGSSGGTTSTPHGTPTCDPNNGCGADHTDPPPTNIP